MGVLAPALTVKLSVGCTHELVTLVLSGHVASRSDGVAWASVGSPRNAVSLSALRTSSRRCFHLIGSVPRALTTYIENVVCVVCVCVCVCVCVFHAMPC
jgi:hypothetical protein